MTRRGDGALRKLEKLARRILRGMKVGVIPALMTEVLKTESKSTAGEVATAYLLVLARRHATETISHPAIEPRTRVWLARRMLNHQRRLDGIHPLPELLGNEASPIPMVAPPPKALPAHQEQETK